MAQRCHTGPADLLRSLAQAERPHLTLEHTPDNWLGYQLQPAVHIELLADEAAARAASRTGVEVSSEEDASPADKRRRQTQAPTSEEELPSGPLQAETMYRVMAYQRHPPQQPQPLPPQTPPMKAADKRLLPQAAMPPKRLAVLQSARLLTAGSAPVEAQPETAGLPSPLVQRARLMPRLARWLKELRQQGPDWAACVQRAARLQSLMPLPPRQQFRWHRQLVLLLDLSPAMWPFFADMARLADWLRREIGTQVLRVQVLHHGPWGPAVVWAAQGGDDAPDTKAPPWRAGDRVLVVSAGAGGNSADAAAVEWNAGAGRLPNEGRSNGGRSSGGRQNAPQPGSWAAWFEELRRRQVQCLLLSPLSAEWLDPALAARATVLQWSAQAPARRWRRLGPTESLASVTGPAVPVGPALGAGEGGSAQRAQPVQQAQQGHQVQPAGAKLAAGEPPAEPATQRLADSPGNWPNSELNGLLALVAITRRCDPVLLRALRHLLPDGAQQPGLEWQVWTHPDVEAGTACTIRPAALARHLQAFGQLPAELQTAALAEVAAQHAGRPAWLQYEETLLQHSAAAEAVRAAPALNWGQRVEEAELFFQAVAAGLEANTNRALPDFSEAAHRLLLWANEWPQPPDVLRQLGRALYRHQKNWPKPAWLPPDVTAQEAPQRYWLMLSAAGSQVLLTPHRESAGPDRWLLRQEPIEATELDAHFYRARTRQRLQLDGRSEYRLGTPGEKLKALELRSATETLKLDYFQRPFGLLGWGRREGVEEIRLPLVDGTALTLRDPLGTLEEMQAAGQMSEAGRVLHAVDYVGGQSPMATLESPKYGRLSRLEYGIDSFGVYADLLVQEYRSFLQRDPVNLLDDPPVSKKTLDFVRSGGWGSDQTLKQLEADEIALQRFRYIPPGQFLMGSPETEPERWKDEGPQHRVTLTQGFWLADTACTQAFWLAVVGGKNPSRFKGDEDLPVENVSWADITQKFLPKLQAWLPEGVEVVLPTEAQWEYACRAGTQTPFSFGEQISPEQVNYEGNYPYNGGPKGEYWRKTVAVKALPANGWGLYQMHGNVWEWCWDGQRPYSEARVVDPLGAVGDGPRAVRGGSWYYRARYARSAGRDRHGRGGRWRNLGFRVALRFKPSQGADAPRVLGPQAQGFGAGGPGLLAPQAPVFKPQAEPGAPGRGGATPSGPAEPGPTGPEVLGAGAAAPKGASPTKSTEASPTAPTGASLAAPPAAPQVNAGAPKPRNPRRKR